MIKLAPFLVIAIMGAYIAVLRANVETLEAEKAILSGNIVTLERAVSDQNNRLETYVAQVAAQQTEIRFAQDRANKAELSRDKEIASLNEWRNKLASEIGNRPKVVSRAAGLAFRRGVRSIEDTTSDSGSEDGGDPSPSVSSPSTSPDSSPSN